MEDISHNDQWYSDQSDDGVDYENTKESIAKNKIIKTGPLGNKIENKKKSTDDKISLTSSISDQLEPNNNIPLFDNFVGGDPFSSKTQRPISSSNSSSISTSNQNSFEYEAKCTKCKRIFIFTHEWSGLVRCPQCTSIQNPFHLVKFRCIYCQKNSLISNDWTIFRCMFCNKIPNFLGMVPNSQYKKKDLYGKTNWNKYNLKNVPELRRHNNAIPRTNPYMIFCVLNRKKITQEFPSFSFGQIGTLLGQKWNELNKEDKRKYKRIYDLNQERRFEHLEPIGGNDAEISNIVDVSSNEYENVQDEDMKAIDSLFRTL